MSEFTKLQLWNSMKCNFFTPELTFLDISMPIERSKWNPLYSVVGRDWSSGVWDNSQWPHLNVGRNATEQRAPPRKQNTIGTQTEGCRFCHEMEVSNTKPKCRTDS